MQYGQDFHSPHHHGAGVDELSSSYPYDPYQQLEPPLASTSSQSATIYNNPYPNPAQAQPPRPASHQQQQQQYQSQQYQPFPQPQQQPTASGSQMMVAARDGQLGPNRSNQAYHRRGESLGTSSGAVNTQAQPPAGRTPYARPAGTGQATTVKASSTTSEFTKRKNWSQHIIDEIQDFMHVLSPQGNVLFTTASVKELTGWTAEEVVGRPIADFVHADDLDGFVREFESCIRSGRDWNIYYRFRMKDERYTIFEVAGHPHYVEEGGKKVCKCVFANGRPYPSKNTAMLDSFLELKMENERLRQELTLMYQDIEGGTFDPTEAGRPRTSSFMDPSSSTSLAAYEAARVGGVIDPTTGFVQADGLIPSSSNTYGALGIGISTSNVKGDPSEKKKKVGPRPLFVYGCPMAGEADAWPSVYDRPQKSLRLDDGEFVCRDCGTVDSPEWRKGPEGPKSLCNACGLRYAKLRSKEVKALKTEPR